ncbi:phage tail protein I [Roseospira goensis]|uniref:Phage tail P2-like protein n=1 Tax=Roseospira goensis TaxID=391922 RepID=A0A7W6WMR4_9PROT|nr:phage tail protein I [Roseospira goensis]MBB4287983.1 phage tail P2-like protein [Roseospira goensis]
MSDDLTGDVSGLLPPNATDLERAADIASGTRVQAVAFAPMLGLWDPWRCPVDLLPWLAWACSVDVWDDAWPEATRRRVIADSYAVHSVKGTVGAVRRALAAAGFDARVIEWFQTAPSGDPYTFRVEVAVTGRAITEATYAEVERVALAAKNVRSHLAGLRAVARVSGAAHAGGAALAGETVTVLPWAARDLAVAGPAHVGGAATLTDRLTVWPEAA